MPPSSASAATIELGRGINLDIWTTWPGEDRWSDPDALLPYPEWRKSLTVDDLRALRDAGFDFIRMPVDPAPFLVDATSGFRDALYESVRDSARLATEAGLRVIVDIHAVPAGGDRTLGTREFLADDRMFESYVDVVRRMARTLSAEDPSQVGLELMNEPTIGCEGTEGAAWQSKQKMLFAAARAAATRLPLVLSGACWSSAEGLAALDPKAFPDDNLLWDFHSYDPFLMTHQGASWAGDFIRYVSGLPFPPHSVPRAELDAAVARVKETIDAEAPWTRRSGMKAYLDELLAMIDTEQKLNAVMDLPFARVAEWATRHGIDPATILLGEFGMIRQEWQHPAVMPASSRAAYYRAMAERAELHGFSWSLWGYGGAFGVVEEFEGRKAEPDVLGALRTLPPRLRR